MFTHYEAAVSSLWGFTGNREGGSGGRVGGRQMELFSEKDRPFSPWASPVTHTHTLVTSVLTDSLAHHNYCVCVCVAPCYPYFECQHYCITQCSYLNPDFDLHSCHRVMERFIMPVAWLPVVPFSCGLLPWKDWARVTVPPDSPLVVAVPSGLSCIRTSSLEMSQSKGRRAGLGFRDVGESGTDGGETEGGTSLVLWWGTGLARLVSPSGSPPLWVAPFCSRPVKHRVG